jgi:hypothetical protein
MVSMMKFIAAAILVLLSALPARAAGCQTEARAAAFEALLKTKPKRAAVEDFIEKNHIYRDKAYAPRKSPSHLVAVISEADCDPLDYQHTQHVFDVMFRKGVVSGFSENLASGGP